VLKKVGRDRWARAGLEAVVEGETRRAQRSRSTLQPFPTDC